MSGDSARFGKYTGNGSATARHFPVGFQPAEIEIKSVNGIVHLHERMPSALAVKNGSANAFLGVAELAIEADKGFIVASTDVALNAAGVDYYWEVE